MSDHATAPTLGSLARRCADTRRALMSLFGGELGPKISLDLMGIRAEYGIHEAQLGMAQIIAGTHRNHLAGSDLYLADADMVALLDAAANSMPDQELHETDLISPRGFVYFAEPLPDRSGQGAPIPIHALSWAFIAEGHPLLQARGAGNSVLITAYVPTEDQIRAHAGDGGSIRPGAPRYLPNATVMWTIGTLIGETFGEIPDPAKFTPGFYQRVIAAFWTLVQQPKMTTTDEQPQGRPTDQRRYRRAGIENPNAPVRIIRLQRPPARSQPATTGDEGTGRKMTVRSVTRGHWRNQYLRSTNSHRAQWIDSYWRGPENAPIKGGERVFLAHGDKKTPPPSQA